MTEAKRLRDTQTDILSRIEHKKQACAQTSGISHTRSAAHSLHHPAFTRIQPPSRLTSDASHLYPQALRLKRDRLVTMEDAASPLRKRAQPRVLLGVCGAACTAQVELEITPPSLTQTITPLSECISSPNALSKSPRSCLQLALHHNAWKLPCAKRGGISAYVCFPCPVCAGAAAPARRRCGRAGRLHQDGRQLGAR